MTDRKAVTACLLLVALLGWNFWLPEMKRMCQAHQPGMPPSQDFAAYYLAGAEFSQGNDPYFHHESTGRLFESRAGVALDEEAHTRNGTLSRYIYPPTALPLFAALSRFSYARARLLWLAGYVSLFLAVCLWASFLRGWRRAAWLLGLCLLGMVTSRPLLMHVFAGQIDLVAASLGIGAFICHERRRFLWSALLLSLATLLKVNPLVLLLYFVVYRRDFRYLAYFIGATGVLALLSLVAVPGRLYVEYVRDILPTVASGRVYFQNQSLIRFVAGGAPVWATLLSAAGLAAFAAWAWRRGSPSPRRAAEANAPPAEPDNRRLFVFTMNVLVLLLFSAVSWSMAYVWAIIPCAWLVDRFADGASPTRLAGVLLAAAMMNAAIYPVPVLNSLNLLGALLLLGILAHGVETGRPAEAAAT